MFGNILNRIRKKSEAEESIEIVPVPALVAVLLNKEKEKGSPLTQDEVINIHDGAACIAMPISVIPKLEERRGYADIDPEQAWEQWQEIREELHGNDNS